MAISGHKTQAVVKRYNIVSGRDIKEAASKLESYLGKQKSTKPQQRVGAGIGTIRGQSVNLLPLPKNAPALTSEFCRR